MFQYKGAKSSGRVSDSGLPMPDAGQVFDKMMKPTDPLVTIVVTAIAGDDLARAKLTVESIYENTKDVKYELYLIDDQSGKDDIMKYFNSLPVKVGTWRVKSDEELKNENPKIREPYSKFVTGRYVAMIRIGAVLTPNWLENLLIVFQEVPNAGIVCATHEADSNLENDIEQIYNYAYKNNVSDCRRWRECFSVYSPVSLYSAAMSKHVGGTDDFFDDYTDISNKDFALKVRASSFKIIMADDCYCHFLNAEKSEFINKHKIYADIGDMPGNIPCSPLIDLVNKLNINTKNAENAKKILVVDDFWTENALKIKNACTAAGAKDVKVFGHVTAENKYVPYMRLLCESVTVGDISKLALKNIGRKFDFIFMEQPLNSFFEMSDLVNLQISMLEKDGFFLCCYENPFSAKAIVEKMSGVISENNLYDVRFEELEKMIDSFGGRILIKSENKITQNIQSGQLANAFGNAKLEEKLLAYEIFMVVVRKESEYGA